MVRDKLSESCKVVSKYFSKEIVMDESFSDFQEKKKCSSGPKTIQKSKSKGVKRKPMKKNQPQKDIRVFVKAKENELVSYSKNFNEICNKSGLDVDSEQLQLVIALSKSLQKGDSSTEGHNSQEDKPLSSQERAAKIKLTLQEYGFKVPNTKINTNRNKRLIKQYKLLLLSEEEKKQIITDKYLKILKTNLHSKLFEENIQCCYNQSELYYKSTNIPFEDIKNTEIFYVKELGLDISHNINLLKDWSEIPGRPLTPTIQMNSFKFTDLTQTELDLMLSGTVRSIKDMVNNKNTVLVAQNIDICIDDNVEVENIIENTNILSNNVSDTNRLSTAQSIVSVERSVSPDLFDDDITILLHDNTTTTKTTEVSFDKKDNFTCFMDLTECVAINNSSSCKNNLNIYQENNVTKRKSDDYMDITECIVTSSKQMCVEKIDLTQEFIPYTINDNRSASTKNITETMDLTQSSSSDVESEMVAPKENESSDDTIIINDNINNRENIPLCEKSLSSDNDKIINQNIMKDNELQIKNTAFSISESLESIPKETEEPIPVEENYCSPTYTYTDHVFDHSYIYDYDNFDDNGQEVDINNSVSGESNHILKKSAEDSSINSDTIGSNISNLNKKSCGSDINDKTSVGQKENIIQYCKSSTNDHDNDLSDSFKEISEDLQISGSHIMGKSNEISNSAKKIDTEESKDQTDCVHSNSDNPLSVADENTNTVNHVDQLEDYNDYVFEHSYIYDYEDRNSTEEAKQDDDENEIDLTQTSDAETTENVIKNDLGKIDNISVDYDDIIVVENYSSNDISKSSSRVRDKEASTCSKNSDVFEVSDKEFNYSLHQSRFGNYDADSFDDIEKESATKSRTLNRSMSENDLNTRDNSTKTHQTTPEKALSQDVRSAIMQTPNNDYIIKTRDVTPMADYASMSSPERAEELKRYGLKPFKRKRAIQLLTYLYNQTHPVVESYEETSSPAKRLKYDTPIQTSPKKSPKKSQSSQSPLKASNLKHSEDKENVLFTQTKELPDIKEVHCDPEDWVFQTREKSKVHSCRVPLHIAFHNYVSCRRHLRESILRYEPVNIDVIHKELVSIGYRYNPKDLLKFMDKKCITVKTTDNNARNKR